MEDSASKPGIDRVPVACIQCRSRHVRCDATQPACRRCVRDRKECVYKKSKRGGLDRAALARRKQRLEQEAAAIPHGTPSETTPNSQTCSNVPYDPADTASDEISRNVLAGFSSGLDLNSAGFASTEMSFHCDTERLLEVFHESFWPAFPFTLPSAHLHQRRKSTANHGMSAVLLVQQWIGSIYAPWTPSEPHRKIASQALASELLPRDPWTVQALILMSFAEHYSDLKEQARETADRAVALALELQMNARAFARAYGEGNAVLEESWRRTYLFLVLLDQHLSILATTPFFALRDAPNFVDLPCDDKEYISGRIPPAATWQDYNSREFADVEVVYSSLAYLYDVSMIVSFIMKMFIKLGGSFNDDFITAVDTKLAAWQALLPSSKRDPVRRDGSIDEIMFAAHVEAALLLATVHRPFSSLVYTIEELGLSSLKVGVPLTEASAMKRSAHTARTLKAIDIQTRLLSIPCALEKHSVMMSSMVARLTTAQISACNVLLDDDDYALTIARDRVRLSLGFLNIVGAVWPQVSHMARELKQLSRATLSSAPSRHVTQQEQQDNDIAAVIEIPRDEQQLLWPIDPASQIDIYAGLSMPVDWEASLMGYTSSSTRS